jgi:glucose/mannose transport system substrate-binding protein
MRARSISALRPSAVLALVAGGLLGCSQSSPGKNRAEIIHLWTSSGESAAVRAMSATFRKAGGTWVDTAVAGGPAERAATISRIVAGDPPSAALSHGGVEFADLANNGVLRRIDTLAAQERWQTVMSPVAMTASSYDGHVYAFPILVEGMNWLWFNKAVLKRLDVDDPQNWDDTLKVLARAKQAGIVPLAFSGTATYERGLFNAVLAGRAGAKVWNGIYADRNPAFVYSPEFTSAAAYFKGLHEYVDQGAPGRTWNEATSMVIRGQAAMQIMGDWAKGEFIAAGQTPGNEFGCTLLRSATGEAVFRTEVLMLPKLESESASQAQIILAKSLTEPKAQLEVALKKGSLPARLDIDTRQLDVCARQAEQVVQLRKAVSSQEELLTPAMAGAFDDVISEYWNSPSMTASTFAQRFAAVLKQSR